MLNKFNKKKKLKECVSVNDLVFFVACVLSFGCCFLFYCLFLLVKRQKILSETNKIKFLEKAKESEDKEFFAGGSSIGFAKKKCAS